MKESVGSKRDGGSYFKVRHLTGPAVDPGGGVRTVLSKARTGLTLGDTAGILEGVVALLRVGVRS